MTDVPEDIMREAEAFVGDLPGIPRPNRPFVVSSLARALLAAEKRGAERERERAASKADVVRQRLEAGRKRPLSQIDEHVAYVADGIAAAIRKEG